MNYNNQMNLFSILIIHYWSFSISLVNVLTGNLVYYLIKKSQKYILI